LALYASGVVLCEERDGQGKKTIYDDVRVVMKRREPTREEWLEEKIHKTRVKVSDSFSGVRRTIDSLSEFWVDVEGAIREKLVKVAGRGETFLPGALYVLTAMLAGNIVTRNRGIFMRWTTPLAFAVGTGLLVAPHTTRNLLREVGIGRVVDSVEDRIVSGADKTVHGISDGYDGFRRRIRGFVGQTEESAAKSAHEVAELAKKVALEAKHVGHDTEERLKHALPTEAQLGKLVDSAKHALHHAEETAKHLIHDAEEKAKDLIHDVEDKLQHAIEHNKVKPTEEFEAGHTRGATSYNMEDQPVPVQIKPAESLFSTVQHLMEDAEEKVKHAFEHDKTKPSKGFESGADLHSSHIEDQPMPGVNGKPTESLLDAAKHLIQEVDHKIQHAMEHDRVKPSKEFESGPDLHTRNAASFDTEDQSVAVNIKPAESLLETAKHLLHDVEDKARVWIHEVEDAVQTALEHGLDPPTDAEQEADARRKEK